MGDPLRQIMIEGPGTTDAGYSVTLLMVVPFNATYDYLNFKKP
jgi:hypothetical protein